MLEEQYDEKLREYLQGGVSRTSLMIKKADAASHDELITFGNKYRGGVTTATPVFAGAAESEIKKALDTCGSGRGWTVHSLRRTDWRALRKSSHCRRDVRAEAAPLGGREDSRAEHRAIQSGDPAAAGW